MSRAILLPRITGCAGRTRITIRHRVTLSMLRSMACWIKCAPLHAALKEHGNKSPIFSATTIQAALCLFLSNERPDVIFNCCESIMGQSKLEMNVAAMYELFGIPYTGSAPLALGLALDKELAKAIFLAQWYFHAATSTLREDDIEPVDPQLRFPLIVKPVHEDASIGIDAQCDCAGFQRRSKTVCNLFSPNSTKPRLPKNISMDVN